MKLKKIISMLLTVSAVTAIGLSAVACGNKDDTAPELPPEEATPTNTYEYNIPQDYCRTYYEVFVRSFADGNGDGIGDIRGLINNLDYLNDGDDSTTTDLGINGIWMMPINASTTYHKYDVVDYYSIDDEYGTLADFDALVKACDERDIWLQMDLVLNHTSTQNKWFKDALNEIAFGLEPDDPEAVNMQKYTFKHQATMPTSDGKWRQVNGHSDYWYLGNFDSSMPDVNLANTEVRAEIEKIVEFWLKKGVRSFRLDAVPWAFANKEAEYMPNTDNIEFWSWFNNMCDEKGEAVYGKRYPGIAQYCYNVGEVWASSTKTLSYYYGSDMSCFNYYCGDVSGAFSSTVNGGTAALLVNNIESFQSSILEASDNALLSNFLSCHDNKRSTSFFGHDNTKIKNAAALYMLMPGNPYIYYGEEIGAEGGSDSKDENYRLHFNWGDDRNVSDPSGATFKREQRHGSMLDQTNDGDSILTYYRRVIQLRNRFPEIGRGVLDALALDANGKLGDFHEIAPDYSQIRAINENNRYIAAYTLTWNNERILIVHNLGTDTISFDASTFADYSIVGELHSNRGGKVSFSNGSMTLDGGTVALLKVAE